MPQQGAFSAAAPAHDDENLTPFHLCAYVAHHHKRPVGHGQLTNLDFYAVCGVHGYICRALQITAKIPSEAMIQVIPVTTAEVVARPTAAALLPHCIPRKQPVNAISTPKN